MLIAYPLNAYGKDVYIQLRNYFLVTDLKKKKKRLRFKIPEPVWTKRMKQKIFEVLEGTCLCDVLAARLCKTRSPLSPPPLSGVSIRNTDHNTEPFPQDPSFEIKVMLSRYFINFCAKTTQLHASLTLRLLMSYMYIYTYIYIYIHTHIYMYKWSTYS